jgi:ferredoxin
VALKIIDECIACDACVEVCPTIAIEVADPIYVIEFDICCECVGYHKEPACVPVCPVDAIVLDESEIEDKKTLLEKFKKSR